MLLPTFKSYDGSEPAPDPTVVRCLAASTEEIGSRTDYAKGCNWSCCGSKAKQPFHHVVKVSGKESKEE